jgi:hypothetical protein
MLASDLKMYQLSLVLIHSKTDPQQSVTLNYTYTNVLPFIESFSLTEVSYAGGDIISVKIEYFPYPSQTLTVRFGSSNRT